MTKAVAKRSDPSAAMMTSAAKGRALMGGTNAMRDASNTYLPKFESESKEAYTARKDSSWLFNGYRKTVRDMTGRVFDRPVSVDSEQNKDLEDWASNIDLQGNDLSTFARRVFQDGMSGSGISYIMVDAPARNETPTISQAKAQNLRPYMIHLRVEDLIGWKSEAIDNVQTLTMARIFEAVEEQHPIDKFGVINIEQIRVLELKPNGVEISLYRKNSKNADKWELYDEPTMTELAKITIIPFYANRSGFFTGEPLLDDLADVNIAHWQSQSDQRNILHAVRVPILFGAGLPEDQGIEISSTRAVMATDPTARLSWVEHDGKAIEAGRQDLKDLEFQMESHGLQLVATQSAQSATGEALDAAKETSTLAMTADQLQDALEQAFIWMLEYSGNKDQKPEVSVNKEFSTVNITAPELQVMLGAVNTGNMSRETFIRTLIDRGVISGEIDPLDELERIEDEAPELEPPETV